MKTTCNTQEAIGGKLMFICHWLAIVSIDSATLHSANQRARCVICGTNLGPLHEGVVSDKLMVFTRMSDLRSDSTQTNQNTTAYGQNNSQWALNIDFGFIICFGTSQGSYVITSQATC